MTNLMIFTEKRHIFASNQNQRGRVFLKINPLRGTFDFSIILNNGMYILQPFAKIEIKQKTNQNMINHGGKLTDMKQGLVKLLESYKTVRKLIQKLTNKFSPYINNVDALVQQIKKFHKNTERQARPYAELQLVNQVESILKNYVNKTSSKVRRYDVYSHVLCFVDLLSAKINEIVSKSISVSTLTPEMMKWKLFLSELNQSKETVRIWLKESSNEVYKLSLKENPTSMYKISTETPKIKTPSTAYMTMNQTSRVKLAQEQLKKLQIRRHPYLKRCQTTNKQIKNIPNKKQYPISIKSPSPKENIKSLRKSANIVLAKKFKRKAGKRKLFYKIESQNQFQNSIQIFQLKQNDEIQKSQKKINNQSYDEKATVVNECIEVEKKVQTQTNKFEAMRFQKSSLRIQRKSSIRKIKQNQALNQTTKSSFANHRVDNQQDQENLSNRSVTEHSKEERMKIIGKQHLKVFEEELSEEQIIEDEQNRQHKENQTLPQFVNLQQKKETINHVNDCKSKFPTRRSTKRHGIISSKQIECELNNLEQELQQQGRERQTYLKRRTIEFNKKMMAEINCIQEKTLQNEQQTPQRDNKLSFNEFYRELAQLKLEQVKQSKTNPWGGESSFFMNQDFLREQKSKELQSYIEKMNIQHRRFGGMFELKSEQSNIKMQNYMMMERKYAFQSDNEWIKNVQKAHNQLNVQLQLFQKDSPQSQWSATIQEL